MRINRPLATIIVLLVVVTLGACVVPATPVATSTIPPPTATPTAEPAPPPTPVGEAMPEAPSANVSTFATGLVYPRGLEFGPDGNLYVAEAGPSGETETMGTCEGYTSMFAPYHIGMTARVSRISSDGTRTTVADNLPSARDQFGDVLGVNDVAFIDDTLYALVMGGGCSRGFDDFPASIVRVNPDGATTIVADLSAFFTANPTAAPKEEDWEPDGAAYSMSYYSATLPQVAMRNGFAPEKRP